jgi:integrase
MRRPRYSGCLLKRGRIFHLQYTIDGVRFRESAETDNREVAAKKLRDKIAAARQGDTPVKATTVKALGELYLAAQQARWKPKTYAWAKGIWENHLEPAFGARNPASILPGDIDAYISKLKASASACYCNRHLVILKAILRYGLRNKALREIPEFPEKFSEMEFVHQGHIDAADFVVLTNMIEESWLEAMVWVAYLYGFRKSELLYMKCRQIDLDRGTIILPAGSTKNRMPRKVVLNPKGMVAKLLRGMLKGKHADSYVFSRDGGSTPVRDFRVSFDKAAALCTTGSGKNGKLHFHDLRRSAITNMDSAGLSTEESMAVAGHLTADVHRRYKILSEDRARKIAERLETSIE